MAKIPAEHKDEIPFIVREIMDTTLYTIPNMSGSSILLDASRSGYVPIGVVGYVVNNYIVTIRGARIANSTQAQILIGNPTSASTTVNDIRLQILYQKV